MYFLLNMEILGIFHCYVSLPEGTICLIKINHSWIGTLQNSRDPLEGRTVHKKSIKPWQIFGIVPYARTAPFLICWGFLFM